MSNNTVRKNDNVVVIDGQGPRQARPRAEGPPEKNRVVVEGVNIIKRHTKPNPQRRSRAASSSARRRCTRRTCSWSARVRQGDAHRPKILGDGRKVRICRKCEGVVDK